MVRKNLGFNEDESKRKHQKNENAVQEGDQKRMWRLKAHYTQLSISKGRGSNAFFDGRIRTHDSCRQGKLVEVHSTIFLKSSLKPIYIF